MAGFSAAPASVERVPQRLAMLSILGVWLFYTCIVSVRAMVLGFSAQGELALRRVAVACFGILITWIFYLILRRFDQIGRAHV